MLTNGFRVFIVYSLQDSGDFHPDALAEAAQKRWCIAGAST